MGVFVVENINSVLHRLNNKMAQFTLFLQSIKKVISKIWPFALLLVVGLFLLLHERLNQQGHSGLLLRNSVFAESKSLSFASEAIPLTPSIRSKYIKFLREHRYGRVGSYHLHQRAKNWFPVIVPILAKYHIPDDFKYIPLIESEMRRSKESHKGAVGFWQLMPHTARRYGLYVSKEKDQRRDIIKSTEAACKYFIHLHKKFHSWTLVAAAYNLGETKMRNHIKQQKERNYFSLRMNIETASYLYKILAVKTIIEKPHRYGYKKAQFLVADLPFIHRN